MPLIVFNRFDSSLFATPITTSINLKFVPPPNVRFTIKQVSVYSNATTGGIPRAVQVNIPAIMGDNDRVQFQTVGSAGTVVTAESSKGLRFYARDLGKYPYVINEFPQISLGRHHLYSPILTMFLRALDASGNPCSINGYSVVIEWDYE